MIEYIKRTTIEGTVKINGTPFELNNRNNVAFVKRVLDEYLSLTAAGVEAPGNGSRAQSQAEVPRPGGYQPQPGETTKDYIKRVLKENPSGLYLKDLTEKVLQSGWPTLSKKPSRALEVVLYKNPNDFAKSNGRWVGVVSRTVSEPARHTLAELEAEEEAELKRRQGG